MEGVWRPVVSRPAVPQDLSGHVSRDVPEAHRYRAFKMDVHDGNATAVIYKYRSKYSQILGRVHTLELIASQVRPRGIDLAACHRPQSSALTLKAGAAVIEFSRSDDAGMHFS